MGKETWGMKGSRSRWVLLATHPDQNNDTKIEPFEIWDLVKDLIVSSPQAQGIQILPQEDDDGDMSQDEEDIIHAGLSGVQEKV